MLENGATLQAKNDRWLDCEAALQRLRGQSANITEEATEIRVTSLLHRFIRVYLLLEISQEFVGLTSRIFLNFFSISCEQLRNLIDFYH